MMAILILALAGRALGGVTATPSAQLMDAPEIDAQLLLPSSPRSLTSYDLAVQDLVTTGLADPYGLALDLVDRQMYWTDMGTDKVQRANLDGTNIEDLYSLGILGSLSGIALDISEQPPAVVPSLNHWGMIWLTACICGVAVVLLRSKRTLAA